MVELGHVNYIDSDPEFHARVWDESIYPTELLEIVNKKQNYLSYGLMSEEAFNS